MDDLVTTAREGVVATVTMNNPERMNVFSPAMRDRLIGVLRQLNADDSCRAIVLTGAGEHFSAGADLGNFPEVSVQQCRRRLEHGGAVLMREIVAGPKPVIAAIEGNAFGAGLALAIACDHAVAARSARFCCAFTKIAFMPDLAVMFNLPRRVGHARAKQIIALAEVISSEEALRIQMVDAVVEDRGALPAALALAQRYAQTPPLAFELTKSVFARGLEDLIQAEIDLQPMAWLSADHAEGKQAFFEKRKPRFTGK